MSCHHICIKIFDRCYIDAGFGGCSTYVSQLEGQAFEPVDPAVNLASEKPSNGAIFRSGQSGLFATDQRARRVGDILTVTFNEIFAATKAQQRHQVRLMLLL